MAGRYDSNQAFERIEKSVSGYQVGNRTESLAQLAWFLHVSFRMEDPEDDPSINEALCDGGNDKGIDALVPSHPTRELFLFQSKRSRNGRSQEGDTELRKLYAAREFFASRAAVEGLLKGKINEELRGLLMRHEVPQLVEDGYEIRLCFVTNSELAKDAREFIDAVGKGSPELLDVWDRPRLNGLAEETQPAELCPDDCALTAPAGWTRLDLAGGVAMVVTVVPAVDLVRLPGIDDLKLFGGFRIPCG